MVDAADGVNVDVEAVESAILGKTQARGIKGVFQ